MEFEYRRGETLAYLAGGGVHQATVFGRCECTTGIVPITALVDQVMSAEPSGSARRVFWVVDNGTQWARATQVCEAHQAGRDTPPRGPTLRRPRRAPVVRKLRA